jgi:glucose-6-phosphate 1-dehydrogenase
MLSEFMLTPVELVIFGVAGDPTWCMLLPSLCNLFPSGLMAKKFTTFGGTYDPTQMLQPAFLGQPNKGA